MLEHIFLSVKTDELNIKSFDKNENVVLENQRRKIYINAACNCALLLNPSFKLKRAAED